MKKGKGEMKIRIMLWKNKAGKKNGAIRASSRGIAPLVFGVRFIPN